MSIRRLGACVAVLALFVIPAAAQRAAQSVVRGEVTDGSGGVLPGVTVTAATGEGQVLATAVSDDRGQYVFTGLPPGPLTLTLQLDGFETVRVSLTVNPSIESRVIERLKVAQITEKVVVVADAPPEPPAITYVPTPRAPKPVIVPLPLEELETICLPAIRGHAESRGRIHSHVIEPGRTLFSKGDEVVIDEVVSGLMVGDNLVVRRPYKANGPADPVTGEQTTGLVQVVSVSEKAATAVVVHACSELSQGDLLASFTPQPRRRPEPMGLPSFGNAIRILFTDAGQLMGAPRRMMVIDRGSAEGVEPGQRLTIFRNDPRRLIAPFVIGEAVVVAVKTYSATIRIEHAADAISQDDWAAPQLASPLEAPRAPGQR
jgi:hypothetical protein